MRKKNQTRKKKKFQLCAHRKSSLFSLATPKESRRHAEIDARSGDERVGSVEGRGRFGI
jgi:hypothetical protein